MNDCVDEMKIVQTYGISGINIQLTKKAEQMKLFLRTYRVITSKIPFTCIEIQTLV